MWLEREWVMVFIHSSPYFLFSLILKYFFSECNAKKSLSYVPIKGIRKKMENESWEECRERCNHHEKCGLFHYFDRRNDGKGTECVLHRGKVVHNCRHCRDIKGDKFCKFPGIYWVFNQLNIHFISAFFI